MSQNSLIQHMKSIPGILAIIGLTLLNAAREAYRYPLLLFVQTAGLVNVNAFGLEVPLANLITLVGLALLVMACRTHGTRVITFHPAIIIGIAIIMALGYYGKFDFMSNGTDYGLLQIMAEFTQLAGYFLLIAWARDLYRHAGFATLGMVAASFLLSGLLQSSLVLLKPVAGVILCSMAPIISVLLLFLYRAKSSETADSQLFSFARQFTFTAAEAQADVEEESAMGSAAAGAGSGAALGSGAGSATASTPISASDSTSAAAPSLTFAPASTSASSSGPTSATTSASAATSFTTFASTSASTAAAPCAWRHLLCFFAYGIVGYYQFSNWHSGQMFASGPLLIQVFGGVGTVLAGALLLICLMKSRYAANEFLYRALILLILTVAMFVSAIAQNYTFASAFTVFVDLSYKSILFYTWMLALARPAKAGSLSSFTLFFFVHQIGSLLSSLFAAHAGVQFASIIVALIWLAVDAALSLTSKERAFVREDAIAAEQRMEARERELDDEKAKMEAYKHLLFGVYLMDKYGLTQRECEVVDYLVQGITTKALAETLVVSFDTAKTHRRNVLHKMEVENTQELADKVAALKTDEFPAFLEDLVK